MNDIELVHIGFNNVIAMNRVIAIVSPSSAPTKRTIQEGRNKGLLIDMTNGRRTKAVIIADSGHIILGHACAGDDRRKATGNPGNNVPRSCL